MRESDGAARMGGRREKVAGGGGRRHQRDGWRRRVNFGGELRTREGKEAEEVGVREEVCDMYSFLPGVFYRHSKKDRWHSPSTALPFAVVVCNLYIQVTADGVYYACSSRTN